MIPFSGIKMMTRNKFLNFVFILFAFYFSSGWGQNAPNQSDDSISSDSLWTWYQSISDSALSISAEDSIAAYKLLLSGFKLAKQALETNQTYESDIRKGQESKISTPGLIQMFEDAVIALESSIRLNPRDARTRNNLKLLYPRMIRLYNREKNTQRAIQTYKALLIADRPKSTYYQNLGMLCYTLKNWTDARNYFNQAIDVELDTVWTAVDTTLLYNSFNYRGQTEIKLNLPFKAIQSLDYARRLAPNEETKNRLKSQIDWIEWDDGNIRASEMWDSLKVIESGKHYSEAHAGYLKLLDILYTKRAQDYINSRIASLDFWALERKKPGIERLYQVVETIPVSSNGAAVDSSYNNYLTSYSRMCYDMGIECIKNNERKQAFIYFTQATVFKWPFIGRSYMRLAELAGLDYKRAITYCQQALTYRENLSESEQKKLYQYLHQFNFQAGNFDEAEKWYVKFLQI